MLSTNSAQPMVATAELLETDALAVTLAEPGSVDMRVLVIYTSVDGNPYELPGITRALDRIGIPYDTMDALTVPLTTETLIDDGDHGAYYAIILTTGDLGYVDSSGYWVSAFDASEWELLHAYEVAFGVRQVTSYTAPYVPYDYGLAWDWSDPQGTTQSADGLFTAAGRAVFDDLTGQPLPIRTHTYLPTIVEPDNVSPLLVTDTGRVLASIYTDPDDGWESLTLTFSKNDWSLHSLLVWGDMIEWVTRGVYLGERHVNMTPQVDDLLIDDNVWDPVALSDETGLTYRITNSDFNTVIAWQKNLNNNVPVAADVRLEMAFNGEGATGIYPKDKLTKQVQKKNDAFSWINHAYSHLNMSFPEDDEGNPIGPATTYEEALAELQLNAAMVAELKLVHYIPEAFVQPDISGLDNQNFLQAAYDFGIRYLISDTSRSEWNNPSPNTGILLGEEGEKLLVIPRHPSNLFYNLTTPQEWVSEYNYYYGEGGAWCVTFGCWGYDMTYQQIIDYESSVLLSYLLKWDIDPLMFHQANLRNYANGQSLLGDLLDATLRQYATYYTLPIRGLTQAEIGEEMLARMAFNEAEIEAEIVPCSQLTLTNPGSGTVTIPVTGLSVPGAELYGGDPIADVTLVAGGSATYPISCTP
jgi:hypothetical protein